MAEQTEYVSIQDAAQRLGVSPDTIRRRVRSGELEGQQEKTAQGFVWRVKVPMVSAAPSVSGENAAGPTGQADGGAQELAHVRAMLEEVRHHRSQLETQLAAQQAELEARRREAEDHDRIVLDLSERLREAHVLLGQAQQALPSRVEPVAQEPAPEAHQTPTAGPQQAEGRAGLWERVRRWVTG